MGSQTGDQPATAAGPTEYGSAISRHDLPEAWLVPP